MPGARVGLAQEVKQCLQVKIPEYAITFWQAVYDSGLAQCFTDRGALRGPLESELEVEEDTASSYAVCAPAQVEWNNMRDPTKGFKYLFLSDADYTSIAARADTAVLKAEPFFAENGAPNQIPWSRAL